MRHAPPHRPAARPTATAWDGAVRVHAITRAVARAVALAADVAVVALVASAACVATLRAQQAPSSHVVRGQVLRNDGTAIRDARVTLLDTGDSTRTDADGRFALATTHRGLATLVARAVGHVPATADLELPATAPVTLRLERAEPVLAPFTVQAAGEFTIGDGTTATLTPLEVAQTPGAAADVARAVQTLPGVQTVDEGNGLFVRGGDVTETRVLVDGAWMLSPARFDNPTGHVTSTLNPFLLSRTVFSAGAFGALEGNALSGLVRMETAGRPARPEGSLGASIGDLRAAAATPLGARGGVRLAAGLRTLAPLLATFGENQPYAPAPRGGDAALTAEWATGHAGRLRLFTARQRGEFGVGAADVQGRRYVADTREAMTVLSFRDSSGALRPSVSLGESAFSRAESIGGFALTTRLVAQHAVGRVAWRPSVRVGVTLGAEVERLQARYAGGARATGDGGATSTDATSRDPFRVRVGVTRRAVMSEVDWRPFDAWRVVAGVRTDDDDLSRRRTVDPRVSLAWQRGTLGLTAAWGRHHQVPEPVFVRTDAASAFTPPQVRQGVVGLQLGDDTTGVRIEGYTRHWRHLRQFTPDFGVAAGGEARARGVDVLLRWRFGERSRSRLAWSILDAERTDPATGRLARAPMDVTHSVVWITDRTFGFLTVSTALRYATGRPFTDIVGAESSPDGPVSVAGAPFGARLPAYWRSDASASWYRPIDGRRALVLWGSLSNVFGRDNVMRYTWSSDFRERRAVLAPFNRSVYAGLTLLF